MVIKKDVRDILGDTYTYFVGLFTNPLVLTIFTIILVGYLLISAFPSDSNVSRFNIDSNSGSLPVMSYVGFIFLFLFIVLVLKSGIFGKIKSTIMDAPRVQAIKTSVVPEIISGKQVFNIPGNTYGYNDAKALCSAYGSRLASYKEIEDAYEKGGEWCNYGWSEGQMALYPTQQNTFDNLQKTEGHENDCGRPGINGGYMANPKLQFGVNCYGYKPEMTEEEEHNMATVPHYPLTKKDIAMEQRVNYWKSKLASVIVSPFNYKNWSRVY